MAYYCGECAVWQGSSDKNRYGERWCSYSRRYEKSDQNTYGCKGFVYVGRAILTKICEILSLQKDEYFACFDSVKQEYLLPEQYYLLTAYCEIGPSLAEKLAAMDNREEVAKHFMAEYLNPAVALVKQEEYAQAADLYRKMVRELQGMG